MSKKNTLWKQFSALTWSDLEEWAVKMGRTLVYKFLIIF